MLIPRKDVVRLGQKLRRKGQQVVFTNGVFDLLHRGHVDYLTKAKALGDILFVGLNSDRSVKRLKGSSRPLQPQADRATILLGLKAVDHVVLFGEDTPERLIQQLKPDVLVKGADYRKSEIVGAGFVESYGGKVRRIRLVKGRSSSRLMTLLKKL